MTFWINIKQYDFLVTALGDEAPELNKRILKVLDGYFDLRTYREWTEAELADVGNHILNMADNLGKKIDTFLVSAVVILRYKSALTLLAADFPSVSETLYYSPLMNQLDELIDTWNLTKNPPVKDYDELYKGRTTKTQMKLPHGWWDVLDTVQAIGDEPYRESSYASVRNKKNASIDKGKAKTWLGNIQTFTTKCENRKQILRSFQLINKNSSRKDAVNLRLAEADEQILKVEEDKTSMEKALEEMESKRNSARQAALKIEKIEQYYTNDVDRSVAAVEFEAAENARIAAEAAFSELMHQFELLYK